LDAYLRTVVTPTLERQRQNGAVAVKFEAAYLRKLDFDNPDQAKARLTYARYVRGGEPPSADYKALQDSLFFYIAREAGRLGLAVHIHCIEGRGGFLRQSGSNTVLLALTGMINDGEIDRPRAMELARMVMHDNAAKLYGFK